MVKPLIILIKYSLNEKNLILNLLKVKIQHKIQRSGEYQRSFLINLKKEADVLHDTLRLVFTFLSELPRSDTFRIHFKKV